MSKYGLIICWSKEDEAFITRAALSTCGGAKTNFLSVQFSNGPVTGTKFYRLRNP